MSRALAWLGEHGDPPGKDGSVFSEWTWGHLVQYFGKRAAVATPFGIDGGPGAMEDTAAFFTTKSPEEAESILAARRARYLLMTDPLTEAAELAALAPLGRRTPPWCGDWTGSRGPSLDIAPDADDLVAARIHSDNGLSPRGLPSLGQYRLI